MLYQVLFLGNRDNCPAILSEKMSILASLDALLSYRDSKSRARSRWKINQPGYRQELAGLASDFFCSWVVRLFNNTSHSRPRVVELRPPLTSHTSIVDCFCQRPKRDCVEWNIHTQSEASTVRYVYYYDQRALMY